MKYTKQILAAFSVLFWTPVVAQISIYPYRESFDTVTAPAFPAGWSGSGCTVSATSARSSPNCVSATGNKSLKTCLSPVLNFSVARPDTLKFWERRSASAASYRLCVSALVGGTWIPLAEYDSIANTTAYVQRSLSLTAAGLQGDSSVQFLWEVLADSTNSTGVLRIDDVELDASAACDLAVSSCRISPVFVTRRDSFKIVAVIRNAGYDVPPALSVKFGMASLENGTTDSLEWFATGSVSPPGAGDSVILSAVHAPLSAGTYRCCAVVSSAGDASAGNDTAYATFTVECVEHDVVINEILYDPLEGQNEWFELYNTGSTSADLAHWTFSDRPTASGAVNTFTISDTAIKLLPQHFAVIAADSTLLTLFPDLLQLKIQNPLIILSHTSGFSFNADSDALTLKDGEGETMDRVAYKASWQNSGVTDTKGRSLERKNPLLRSNDPNNWSTCTAAAGGTPACANSIYTAENTSGAMLSVAPNPFSPDGDGFEDNCMIGYSLSTNPLCVTVRLYDIRGRMIRVLANNDYRSGAGNILWNGCDESGRRVRIGVYIVLLEAVDPETKKSFSAKTVIVAAKKL